MSMRDATVQPVLACRHMFLDLEDTHKVVQVIIHGVDFLILAVSRSFISSHLDFSLALDKTPSAPNCAKFSETLNEEKQPVKLLTR